MGTSASKPRGTGESNRKLKNPEKEKIREKRSADLKLRVNTSKDETDGDDIQSKKKVFASDERDLAAKEIDPKEYDFPFENLVFEGGGNKGLAYCGSIKVLEDCRIYSHVKRFAGASAGAMTAALLAVGCSSDDIMEFLSQDLSSIFLDHSCGYLSFLPNLLSGYGWNPGKKIYKWFGIKLKEKTGRRNITFAEVYEEYDKELCIVVTNLNQMSTEYCHPKTTPDMAIRLAVRMSMSIPGLFQVSKQDHYGHLDTYVDGGVLCNYPIHCYDGWYLSLKPGDNFLKMLHPLSEIPRLFDIKNRFGTYNAKTLGFLLYSENEQDVLRFSLDDRVCVAQQEKPDTALKRERDKQNIEKQKMQTEHHRIVDAVEAFLKVLHRHNLDDYDVISMDELEAAFQDEETFSRKQAEILFGKGVTVKKAFAVLDEDNNKEIRYHELVHFIEESGISLQTRFFGYERRKIKNLVAFINTLQSALLTNIKRIYVEDRDIERTVGINTGHVGTSDFNLEQADRDYVFKQGSLATISFLKYYVGHHQLPKRQETATVEKIPNIEMPTGDENLKLGDIDVEKKP